MSKNQPTRQRINDSMTHSSLRPQTQPPKPQIKPQTKPEGQK
jgi:hypothetical protein